MSVKGRIVVIDDEVNAAAALETLLREDGYDVARAHDARGGLQLVHVRDAQRVPDLLHALGPQAPEVQPHGRGAGAAVEGEG